jgi:hypothetical protein
METITPSPEPKPEGYFDFQWAKTRFDKIISEWDVIVKDTQRSRLLRYIKADKVTLTSLGLFKEDEMYVATRLIDQNIRAEQPQRIAYITQPRRSVILKPLGGVEVPQGLEKLEMVFTDMARYLGWEKPFIKVDDGASTHGWDFVEIVFDEAKPGHFGVEQVGHENLMFDIETEDIHNQELLLRRLKVTANQLKKWRKEFGFSATEVDNLIETDQKNESKTKDTLYDIYKCFFRADDVIYVSWYGGTKGQDFLKVPEPLYLGIHDLTKGEPVVDPLTGLPTQVVEYPRVAETSYPFFQLAYIESEAPKIVDVKGRVFLDEPAQEAASAILSGIVNGTMRASNVYAAKAPSNMPDADNAAPKQTDIKIKHGLIFDKPLTFFSTPYPPESAIQALGVVTQQNKMDISRPDYAVKNRQDSRKTATEVAASVNDAAQLGTIQAIQQSVFMRAVYTKGFEIFQNRSLQGKIFVVPELTPLLKIPFDIKAAGDVDVIQRQEKLQAQMQAWPIIAATPLAIPFLKDILTNKFPEEAARYTALLDQGDKGKQLVQGLAKALQVAVTDDDGQIKPEFAHEATQLGELEQQVKEYLQPPTEGTNEPQPANQGA